MKTTGNSRRFTVDPHKDSGSFPLDSVSFYVLIGSALVFASILFSGRLFQGHLTAASERPDGNGDYARHDGERAARGCA